MTLPVFFPQKYGTLKVFLISIFCHVIFFSLFTFTFNTQQSSAKPLFVFFGSILRESDLDVNPEDMAAPKLHPMAPRPIELLTAKPYSQNQPLASKPSFSNRLIAKNKVTIKPRAHQVREGGKPVQNQPPLGIPASIPARVPLKLDNYD